MPQHPPCPPPPPPHTHTHARTFTAGLLSVETYTACDAPPPEGETRELLAAVDVFSPNVAEAASVVGPGEPPQLLARLMALGAHTVLLRMAEAGVLIGRRRRRRRRSSSSSSSSSSGGGSSGSGGGSSGGGSEGAGGGDGGYDQWHVSGADRGACKGDAAGLRNSHRAPDTTHTHTHTHTHTRARARARTQAGAGRARHACSGRYWLRQRLLRRLLGRAGRRPRCGRCGRVGLRRRQHHGRGTGRARAGRAATPGASRAGQAQRVAHSERRKPRRRQQRQCGVDANACRACARRRPCTAAAAVAGATAGWCGHQARPTTFLPAPGSEQGVRLGTCACRNRRQV
jgi:hypothetical protein